MEDILLAAIVLLPAIFVYILRSSGALSFLTLCASFVLVTFASADLKDLTKDLNLQISPSVLSLFLMAVPFLLTLLLTRKAFSGIVFTFLHTVAALCAGGLLALITVPLLNSSSRTNIAESSMWMNLQKAQAAIIISGVFFSLMIVWLTKPRRPHKSHK